ncbi:MAG TPA: hypothetical protein VNI84_06060 [Pyrinomonadaceae bacterium]|nr:hypothetical protein [Pyrinomonadaceae bacterium]
MVNRYRFSLIRAVAEKTFGHGKGKPPTSTYAVTLLAAESFSLTSMLFVPCPRTIYPAETFHVKE